MHGLAVYVKEGQGFSQKEKKSVLHEMGNKMHLRIWKHCEHLKVSLEDYRAKPLGTENI